jgi:uncharacterized iron-regulated membrane protein
VDRITAEEGGGVVSALYRRVWRWHFYAGLVCLPFLVLLALTGGLYLFKEPIESWVYASLRQVPVADGPAWDAQALVEKALVARPGEAVRFVAPAGPGRSAEVGVRGSDGVVAVYLDPIGGRVIGTLRDDERLMDVVRRLHSLAIVGPMANHWIEIVAGWAIVLVVSGLFLWWPRGRKDGVITVRARPAQRLWWRDVHAVTGVFAAAAVLFLAVTGMPWSAFWGQQFGRLASSWGLGTPPYVWGGTPQSQAPLADLRAVPWSASHAPLPASTASPHEGHVAPAPSLRPQAAAAAAAAAPAPDPAAIGLNRALQRLAELGLPKETPVRLPAGPRGVYSAMHFPDDVREVRIVHLDRYSGAALADIRHSDYGALAQATEWGISIHTGRQFGWPNQLAMLAGCLAIVTLAVSAAVMWWKRRPRGRLAAPPRRAGERAAAGAVVVAVLLGLLYPLLGASMLVALVIDTLVPLRWHQRFGL